ncbi:MAG: hypothetical protein ACTHU0_27885 [Kofleriaceae bacterium]
MRKNLLVGRSGTVEHQRVAVIHSWFPVFGQGTLDVVRDMLLQHGASSRDAAFCLIVDEFMPVLVEPDVRGVEAARVLNFAQANLLGVVLDASAALHGTTADMVVVDEI